MAKTDIIIHDEKDNVGVVVIDKITPNQDCSCWIMENDKTRDMVDHARKNGIEKIMRKLDRVLRKL